MHLMKDEPLPFPVHFINFFQLFTTSQAWMYSELFLTMKILKHLCIHFYGFWRADFNLFINILVIKKLMTFQNEFRSVILCSDSCQSSRVFWVIWSWVAGRLCQSSQHLCLNIYWIFCAPTDLLLLGGKVEANTLDQHLVFMRALLWTCT